MQNKSEAPPSSDVVLPTEYARLKRPKPSLTLEKPYSSLFIGLIMVILVLVLAWDLFGTNIIVEYKLLSHEVESTKATIVDINKVGSGDSPNCRIQYDFKAPDKNGSLKFIQESKKISCSLYDELKVLQNIEILYVTSNPSVSVIKSEHHFPSSLIIAAYSFMVLLGLGISHLGFNALSRRKQLSEGGKQTQAILFDRWEEKDSEDSKSYYVAYAFKILTNQGEQIISLAEDNEKAYQQYRVGDSITIRYLPEKPENVCQIILKI